ncbi:MAG: serine/threonine protein kinase [Myxococcales bacterium]|nr:serine/threonine protein kinase [Myxococcales bacterium]MBL9109664.1 serine/threonine protein kinase [Myxococcales bacterium]
MKRCPRCHLPFENALTTCVFDGSTLERIPDPRIGTTIADRYLVGQVIGEGGMATVYEATNKVTGKTVAVKVMNPLLASDPVVRERFRREAKNAQKLTHPNIIEIFDQGDTEDGTAFIAMERLHGAPLSATIGARTMTLRRALHIMVQCARGIARAHDLDVIHRDIKPDNIFLCHREDGSDLVKLLDFGIARSRHDSRLTGQGELFGTPQYMAPERIKSSDTGPSADLYAFGVVFYELLTGELPFDAPDIATFFVKHLRDIPGKPSAKNPEVPEELDALVLSMLAKEPDQRPVDGHRIQSILLGILEKLALDAPPSPETLSESSGPRITLEPASPDVWKRRTSLCDEMLALAYGQKEAAPSELLDVLANIHELVARHDYAKAAHADARHAVEDAEQRGRDKRLQLGFAVDQLGQDASRAKEESRAAAALVVAARAADAELPKALPALQKELLFWEGRCAFREPSADLAAAYEALGKTIRDWLESRANVAVLEAATAGKEARVSDIDFQIRELRAALARAEQEAEDERAREEARARELEATRELVERELQAEMQKFCLPLKQRQELRPLFRELEGGEGAHA